MSQQSAIYNHRALQPTGAVLPQPAPQPSGVGGPSAVAGPPGGSASASASRLSELLDVVRQEFDAVSGECTQLRSQRDEYEGRVGGQINELTAIRNALYDLESQHAKIRQQYESEVATLKAELAAVAASQQTASAQQPPLQSHPPPQSAHLPSHSGPPSYPPPPPEPYYAKGRAGIPLGPDAMDLDDRDRQRDREREMRERDRERERERDREMRDREMRDRDQTRRDPPGKKGQPPPSSKGVVDREPVGPPRPASSAQIRGQTQVTPKMAPGNAPVPPPSTSPFISSRDRDSHRDRDRDHRDRMAVDRDEHLPPPPPGPQSSTGNTPHPYGPPAQGGGAGGSGSASAPVVHGPVPPPGHPSYREGGRGGDEEKYHPAEEANGGPGPVGQPPSAGPLVPTASSSSIGSNAIAASGHTMAQLMDMDPESVPSEHKKNGSDWYAIFNPQVKRVLDINLVMSLSHESVVCCVRFSNDGKYLATGCNRTAQIYDTKTGAKTCVLADENASQKGDLYIRSVCFSPDGKLLATGAEDKRVRIWDIAKRKIRQIFDGHSQEIYSLDFSRDGRKIVSGSGDKTARIWDMDNGEHTLLAIIEPDTVDAGVTSVAISSDGRHVAAGSLDTIVRIWDVATGHLIERLRGHQDSVYSVAFTPDGKGLVSGSLDKSLKYWNLEPLIRNPNRLQPLSQGGSVPSGQQPVTKEGGEKGSNCTVGFSGHKDYVLSVAVSPDGAYVVSGSKDRGVQFWDPRSSQTQLMLQGHKNSVISIDLSPAAVGPGSGLLATGSGDWHARVWSYGTSQQ